MLGNGETVHVRPIRPDDAPALAAFHERQSPESIYRRYFSPRPRLSAADLEHFTVLDMVDRVALVVERHGEFIAWASYERLAGRDDADAAFQVDDQHHGKGIATLLLEHLAAIARANGITRFTAEVLADNRPMLAVFSRAGWPVERRYESGVVDLDFSLDETEEFLDSVERREQRADSRAVARLLLPRTIAVVGASDTPGSVGQALWRHVTGGATGSVFPVNPRHDTVGGRTAYPTLRDVPVPVSLAVVAVPAHALPGIVDDCIASHVRGAVIITSVEGTDIDVEALVEHARSYGVRLIGPGSMGIASSRPSIGLQASLVPVTLPPGNVAISLQSGSLGASLLRHADELRMGLSWFVSLGDKGDVSGNDLLQFWEDDDTTRVIAMYTESFGNPRKFARIARRVSQKRPIVAVRTGAALIGPSGGALYQHAGLIEVPTVPAMLDTARLLAMQPVLRGPRIAVLTNARSPETLSRAALTAAGLIPVDPPIGLDWRSTPAEYGTAVRAALEADDVDGLLVVHTPPLARAVAAPGRRHRHRCGGQHQAGRRRADGRAQRAAPRRLAAARVLLPRAGRRGPRSLVPVRHVAAARGRRRRRRGGGRHRPGQGRRRDRRCPRARGHRARHGGGRRRAVGLRHRRAGHDELPGRRRRRRRRCDRLPGRRQGAAPPPRPVGARRRRPRPRQRRRRHPRPGRDGGRHR